MELRPPPIQSVASKGPRTGVLLALQAVTLLSLAGLAILLFSGRARDSSGLGERTRTVASQLKAAGALDEAASLYEQYLAEMSDNDAARAKVAYNLAELQMENGQYEKALRWLYEADKLGAGQLQQAINEKIVHCLERLGRVNAARQALSSRVQLEDKNEPQRPANDAVVARIGSRAVYASDLQRALDDLPPELRQHFATPEKRQDFLRKYVADELLYSKAQKLEYDKDADVRRRYEALFKQLVVSAFVEREILGKIEVSEADLRTYYTANKSRYDVPKTDKSPAKERSFEEAKKAVEQDYRMMKMQAAYEKLVGEELTSEDVKLFPEALGKP